MRVLITGASGGLGKAVTRTFLEAGWEVIGVSRSLERADFGDAPRFRALAVGVDQLEAALAGWETLDAVVHLVGGWAGGQPVSAAPADELSRMLEINLLPAWQTLRATLGKLRRNGGGAFIGVGSRAAVEAAPQAAAYGAAKAGLVALLRAAAAEEAAHHIRINCVLPGTLDTPANRAAMPGADFSRWVPVERVASLILWLASEPGASTTGAAIPIYGEL
jgi:NAD(P)-dependent dehydrogenase (short-subunit alcohol dehydrogenase family)